jgi:hypothetical protein
MPTPWKTIRVIVELPSVGVPEKVLRLAVEDALTDGSLPGRVSLWKPHAKLGRVRVKSLSRVLASGVLAGVLAGCVGAGSPRAPAVHLGATASHSPLQGFPTHYPAGAVLEDYAPPPPPLVVYQPYPVYDATVGNFPAPIKSQERCVSTFNDWSRQVTTRCR